MYKLYGRPGAGSMAPQLVMEELKIGYDLVFVDPAFMKSAEFLKINPNGRVPALILPSGQPMFESAAMCIHLTDSHPSHLAPEPGTTEHALYLQWMVYLSGELYGAYLRLYYPERYSSGGQNDAPRVKDQATSDLLRVYGVIEDSLKPGLLGTELSAADLYLFMLTTWHLPSAEELYRRFPRIGALSRSLAARPRVAKVLRENA